MNGLPCVIALVGQIVNLGMTVVTGRNAIGRLCCQNLVRLEFPVAAPLFRISRLEEPAAAAAAIVVRPVGIHFDEIFFAHHRLHRVPQIFGHRIPKGFADQLTGVLYGKFDFKILVPVGIDLQLSFFDPLGIILDDALDFKIVFDVEFFQSGPDCKKFVPSLGIEPDLGLEIIHGFGLDPYNMFPGIVIGKKHAVVFSRPSLGAVCPVGTDQV